jgi:hypothetical protein
MRLGPSVTWATGTILWCDSIQTVK